MTRLPLLAAAILLLAGCATHGEPKPAVCDGKHRRPANPYGSVLPKAPAPGASVPPVTSGTPPKPGPQSSIDPHSVEPCGAHA